MSFFASYILVIYFSLCTVNVACKSVFLEFVEVSFVAKF